MSLSTGSRLGPYEILSPLGSGGMGEVYRARDTRLDRDVAVKVLPPHLSSSPEMRQRLEREARAISRLSHPNICALYDVGSEEGVEYLVMELLEGETLAARLSRGPVPSEQLFRWGAEIAGALDTAHRQGIVHRDLKPGNVMLTKSGVKLLDFGLAKAVAAAAPKSSVTALPTAARELTQEGTILGTFQYMSPEQLEGRDADSRSDIFALGAVLYEMATGRKAFEGKSQASLIAAILTAEPPPVSAIQPMSPPALDRVVRTCLAKDPDDRWQSAHDIASELKWIAQGSQTAAALPAAARSRIRERVAWVAAAAAVAVAMAVAIFARGRVERPPPIRLSLGIPERAPFQFFDHVTLSPNGRLVAFVGHAAGGKRSIWVRPLASLSATPLPGTEGATGLFWSPNSASIGFFADGKLKRIEAAGGPPQVLADADLPSGGAWNPDGVILFSPGQNGPLRRVAATGGRVTAATKMDPAEEAHIWPWFLPDGRHFVFLGDASVTANHSIRLGSLESLESVKLVNPAVTNVAFSPPDWLLFARAGSLVAQRLDLGAKRLVGEPIALGEQIALVDPMHGFDFSSSATGALVYRTETAESQLVWLDRSGKRLATIGEPGRYGRLEISPDGRQAAFERLDADLRHGNLWLMDLSRGATSRLTSTASSDYVPIWSPDGKRILFGSARSGPADIFEIPAGGGGSERLVFHDAGDKTPLSWFPDARSALIMVVSPATHEDIWLLPLSGQGKPRPLIATRFSETDAQVSPDGRWVAYSSNESGRTEVYVQSVIDVSTRYRVSTNGGFRPRWQKDGKGLLFLSSNGLHFVALTFGPGTSLDATSPKDLFPLPRTADYTISQDGRILAAVSVDETMQSSAIVVLNWTSELSR